MRLDRGSEALSIDAWLAPPDGKPAPVRIEPDAPFNIIYDMIISGGFSIYPSDLEAVLFQHPAVRDTAVVGLASRAWRETPVGFVVLRLGVSVSGQDITVANERLGRRSDSLRWSWWWSCRGVRLGRLKRELRDRYS